MTIIHVIDCLNQLHSQRQLRGCGSCSTVARSKKFPQGVLEFGESTTFGLLRLGLSGHCLQENESSLLFYSCDTEIHAPTFQIHHSHTPPIPPSTMSSKSQVTYGVRASNHPNPLARKLFQVAEAKKSNLTVSADVTTTKELLDLADRMRHP